MGAWLALRAHMRSISSDNPTHRAGYLVSVGPTQTGAVGFSLLITCLRGPHRTRDASAVFGRSLCVLPPMHASFPTGSAECLRGILLHGPLFVSVFVYSLGCMQASRIIPYPSDPLS